MIDTIIINIPRSKTRMLSGERWDLIAKKDFYSNQLHIIKEIVKRGKKESEKISNMRDIAFVFLKRKNTAKNPPIKKPRIENPGRRKT